MGTLQVTHFFVLGGGGALKGNASTSDGRRAIKNTQEGVSVTRQTGVQGGP